MPTFSFPSGTVSIDDTASSNSNSNTKKSKDRKKVLAPESPVTVEEEYTEPTFPDIVILKQTEHNYIVKHNNYQLPQTQTQTGSTHEQQQQQQQQQTNDDISDLVSPNQIHKNQINRKRGRKPKAGLLLNSNAGIYGVSEVPNIILHLK